MNRKRLLIAAGTVGSLLAGLSIFVATRPDTYHVERTLKIDAPADVVFAQLDDLHAWAAWSPWDKLDPAMTKAFEGPQRGVGASYSWQGNDKVGKGKMTVVESQAPSFVAYRLEFIEPFADVSQTTMRITPGAREPAVSVTWAMDGKKNFVSKLFCLFVNMDQEIGGDFDKGLAQLKTVTEAAAHKAASSAPPAP
jgi:hypothetical protein